MTTTQRRVLWRTSHIRPSASKRLHLIKLSTWIKLKNRHHQTWHSRKIHSWGPTCFNRVMYWKISVTMSSTCS